MSYQANHNPALLSNQAFEAEKPVGLLQRVSTFLQLLPRRRKVLVELARGVIGLAALGCLGGTIGSLVLGSSVNESGQFAAAFQAGMGSLMVSGLFFAVLGAFGRVVFADVVGDWRKETGSSSHSREDRFAEIAIEFVGGAMWGIVCGLLIGVTAAVVGAFLAIALGPVTSGAVGGAGLGLILASWAAVFRSIRTKQEARRAREAAVALSAYFVSAATVAKNCTLEEMVKCRPSCQSHCPDSRANQAEGRGVGEVAGPGRECEG